MKKLLLAFAFLLLPSLAQAQCNGQFQNNQFCGVASGGPKLPGPVTISSFTAFTSPIGTFSNFTNDDGAAINAALAAASSAGGGWVLLNPNQPYWASTQITVPAGVTLGCVSPPQKQLTSPNYVSIGCSVYLAPNNPIIVNGGAVRNAHILQDNIHFAGQPATTHALAAITAAYSSKGTGIKMNAADSIVEDVAIAGFNLDIEDNSLNRGSIRHVLLEGTSCIKYDAVGDYSKGLDIECWPFYSTNRAISTYTMAISNVADNGSGSWRVTLSGAPSEALVTGDTIFIGGTGAITIPQGALGQHTITVIDSTHFDLTGSLDAPAVTGTTTSGSPYVTGLATLNDLWIGETFTGTCFTGARTVQAIQQNFSLIADANATSTGSCTLTFASQAFAATGNPQAIFSGRTDWTGVGVEFGGGGSASGGLFDNFYVWGHQVALQFDPNCITVTVDTASIDFTASSFNRNRVGIWFKAGAFWNHVFGNSFTSGGTAVWNQNGSTSLTQANMVKLGRMGAWTWGPIENDSGSMIVSGAVDVDNSAVLGQFNADVFNVSGQKLTFADGSRLDSGKVCTSVGGCTTAYSLNAGTSGLTIDSSSGINTTQMGTAATGVFGATGATSGQVVLLGSTSGLSGISSTATGSLQVFNNTAGQSIVFNDGGSGTMFAIKSGIIFQNVLTVATLPSCVSGIKGARAFVTDNNTAIAYHGAISSGGTNQQSVTCDGTNWYQD